MHPSQNSGTMLMHTYQCHLILGCVLFLFHYHEPLKNCYIMHVTLMCRKLQCDVVDIFVCVRVVCVEILP